MEVAPLAVEEALLDMSESQSPTLMIKGVGELAPEESRRITRP